MEQYEARAVPQSDFYSLGMTLVFLLSHRDPTQIARTGMTLDFRPSVHVSDRFAALIEWMIAPNPEDRPSSAERIIGALNPNLDRLPELPIQLSKGGTTIQIDRRSVRRGSSLMLGVLLL